LIIQAGRKKVKNHADNLNKAIGHNWAVYFTEVPLNHRSFLVDIQATENGFFVLLIRILLEAFPDTEFSFWKPGPPYVHLGKVPARTF